MRDLQTTIPGIVCMICAALICIYGSHSIESLAVAAAIVASGRGLMKAKDAND